jgi:predicted nuclease of restriction endonuclease-like RecB superfamily
MLTADLALSRRHGERIEPRYLNPKDPGYLQQASDLFAVFGEHVGRQRAALEEALADYVGVGTGYRILRGMIKLLMDRCAFEVGIAVDPSEIRRALFLRARAHHPVSEQEAVRAEIIAEAARELGCGPEEVSEGMYADLPERQRLVEFDAPAAPPELLDLYNLAQAQALLYRSVEMRLRVEPQSPEGYRELFGAIKAYRLIHTVKGSPAEGYEIRLDGPVSMFHRSQKYGIQMAVFLPALLLCRGWRMRAEISTKPGTAAYFELDSRQTRLRSSYVSITPYANPVIEKFAESWERRECAWELEECREVIDLGASAFIPDFRLADSSGRVFYLEILGFWTPQHLSERLAELADRGLNNFILAAWDELRGSRDPLTKIPPHTIVFKKNLDPAIVELSINKIVSGEL